MVKTQIQLTEEQARKLRHLASRKNLSVAELIRRSIHAMLAEPDRQMRWDRALSVAGRFRSGRSDVARAHDHHLADLMDPHGARQGLP